MDSHGSIEEIPMKRRPIGVFDSGIGGLTVVRQILDRLPNEDIVYFGDTARVPYGVKSPETVTRFSREAMHFLMRRGIKLFVVACNSASAVALETMQRECSLPMLGVIRPGARAAVRTTKNRRIGVIGTPATIGSIAYEAVIAEHDPTIEVFGKACPLFVPLAEEGWTTGAVAEGVARTYLDPLLESRVDTLILGCTHYPLLKETIQEVAGPHVTLIDTAVETAVQVEELLEREELVRSDPGPGQRAYFVSDVPEQFRQVGERFLGFPIDPLSRVDQNDLPWYER